MRERERERKIEKDRERERESSEKCTIDIENRILKICKKPMFLQV